MIRYILSYILGRLNVFFIDGQDTDETGNNVRVGKYYDIRTTYMLSWRSN